MSATIVSYRVGVTRSHKPGPSRWLTLTLEAIEQGARTVEVFFYEKDLPALGFFRRETASVVANLPLADFAPMYQVLNTEKPVFANFRTHPQDDRLLSLTVSTSDEPVGEGPTDQSP